MPKINTPEERAAALLEDCKASGLTIAGFCRGRGIGYSMMFNWMRDAGLPVVKTLQRTFHHSRDLNTFYNSIIVRENKFAKPGGDLRASRICKILRHARKIIFQIHRTWAWISRPWTKVKTRQRQAGPVHRAQVVGGTHFRDNGTYPLISALPTGFCSGLQS